MASRERVLAAMPVESDEQVRERLAEQEGAWRRLALLVQEREIGGIAVSAEFVEQVKQATLLAKRQRELIELGEDDPVISRQSLERFGKLWTAAEKYLAK